MSSESPPSRPDLAHYGLGARALDSLGILGFLGAAGANTSRVAQAELDLGLLSWSAFAAGYVAADLFSGLVHWFFDTWLSARTPVLGALFVRPFREHHVDPLSITRHDFVEVNGSNCLATCPVLLAALALDPATPLGQALVLFLVALCVGIFATNQFHRWAHLPAPPRWLRLAQATGLILGREHHARHHAAPYDSHYCITTGWLNPLLDRIGFFRGLEALISRATGARPRAEDAALG